MQRERGAQGEPHLQNERERLADAAGGTEHRHLVVVPRAHGGAVQQLTSRWGRPAAHLKGDERTLDRRRGVSAFVGWQSLALDRFRGIVEQRGSPILGPAPKKVKMESC